MLWENRRPHLCWYIIDWLPGKNRKKTSNAVDAFHHLLLTGLLTCLTSWNIDFESSAFCRARAKVWVVTNFFMQRGTLWSKQRHPPPPPFPTPTLSTPPSSRQLGPLPLHFNNKVTEKHKCDELHVCTVNATLHRWCHYCALNMNQFTWKRDDLIFQGIAAYLLFFLKQYWFSLVDSKYMRHRGRVPLPLLASVWESQSSISSNNEYWLTKIIFVLLHVMSSTAQASWLRWERTCS